MLRTNDPNDSARGKGAVFSLFLFFFALYVVFLFAYQLERREFIWKNNPDYSHFFQTRVEGDELEFAQIAYNVRAKQFYSMDGRQPTAYRMPLFPLAVSIIFLFTTDPLYGMILNCLLTALIALLSFKIARLFWSYKVSLICMIMVGLRPAAFGTYLNFCSEPMYSLMLLCSLYYFCRLIRERTSANASWVGVFSGLTTLSRAEGILLIPIYFLYMVYSGHFKKRLPLSTIGCFLICSLTIIAPWAARNYLSMNYLGMSTGSGDVFAGAHNKRILDRHPGSWGGFPSYASPEEIALVSEMDEVTAADYKWQRGWTVLKEYSYSYLLFVEVKKLFNTFRPTFNMLETQMNKKLNWILVSPFFIFYLLFLGHLKTFLKEYSMLMLPWIIPITVTLIFWGTERWRMPCEPIAFMLMTAHLLTWLSNKYPSSKFSTYLTT